jgi:uncharacterized repeat protein (TIGR01451 family)
MPHSARRARFPSIMVVLFLVSLTGYLGASPVAAATTVLGGARLATSLPPTATFNTNLLLAGSGSAAEPSIRTDRFGRSFVIAPIGVPAGCKAFRVTHDGSASTFIGFPDHTAGGGDCDWAIGPQETAALPGFGTPSDDALAYSSLTLANITTGKSNDGGTTFGPPNAYSQQIPGDDRMWMTADPKLNSLGFADVYMTYHDIHIIDIQLGVSRDGGQTYVQNGPIINPTDVPQAQWQGSVNAPPGPAGNGLGNIVARRPLGGSLTLYSIFVTPDSEQDNINQGLAATGNFNRVYEAVGTVTDVPAPGAAIITWRNYEVYHGPIGSRYDRIFPITAVDAGGRVYAIWTDGNNIMVKADATGTGWNPATAPGLIPNPAGVNTTIMPWADAGKAGIADVVFYGAQGGAGAQPSPQDDINNQWNAYMAQTIDGGATWGVFKASDHVIHTGPICIDGLGCNLSTPARDRTLLDFFQVSVDPTNGAADITYADDHAAPGNSVLYFTRQCTGASATTGAALVNDCKVPPPPPTPPQGTTCPGPQILDVVNDSPNNYPGGSGQNMDELDIENAFFGSSAGSANIDVTLTIKNLQAPPTGANPNVISGLWTVYWQQAGTANAPGGSTWWFAQATTSGTGRNAVTSFSDGTFDVSADSYAARHTVTGAFNPGLHGTFVIHVPRANVGNPADGATLTNTFADTAGAFLVAGTGLRFIARADRAPDSNYGSDYNVAQTCRADLAMTKMDAPDPAHVGQNLTYTIVVTNNGPDKAIGVAVTDQLPKNAGYGSSTSTQGSCTIKPSKNAVVCTIGTMSSGASVTITLLVKPTSKGTITNTASVTLTSPTDPNTANNTATATTTVTP